MLIGVPQIDRVAWTGHIGLDGYQIDALIEGYAGERRRGSVRIAKAAALEGKA